MPPPTGSYPGVRSGWAERVHVAVCWVWGVCSLGDEWSSKREEASKEGVFISFFFSLLSNKIYIYRINSEQERKILAPLS